MLAVNLSYLRGVYFCLIALGVLSYSAFAQDKNPWTYDAGLRETTGLCTVSSQQSGLQIQLTRQDNIDVGMTLDFAPATRPQTPQVSIVYANGQTIAYATVETGPSRLTLLPGAADGFSEPLKSADGGIKIMLPKEAITIGSAQTALLIAAMEDCAGTPLPVSSPLSRAPTALVAETPSANITKNTPETLPVTTENIEKDNPDLMPDLANNKKTENDDTPNANQNDLNPPLPKSTVAPFESAEKAPVTGLIQRHMDESDDGGLERTLLEEWAEKMSLLEKENIALRNKMRAEIDTDKLQDLRVDPMAKIREDALRRKVEELQEEVQKTRAEAQRIAAEKEALIDAQPPPLPTEENAAQDLPPVLEIPVENTPPAPPVQGPPPAPPKLFTVPRPPVKAEESAIPAIPSFGPPSPQ